MNRTRWQVRLTKPAEADFREILLFTRRTFGAAQATVYKSTVLAALTELGEGPDIAGSGSRDAISPGLRILHVARHGRRGRHFILYRSSDTLVIEVLRILHDAMDLARHVPSDAT